MITEQRCLVLDSRESWRGAFCLCWDELSGVSATIDQNTLNIESDVHHVKAEHPNDMDQSSDTLEESSSSPICTMNERYIVIHRKQFLIVLDIERCRTRASSDSRWYGYTYMPEKPSCLQFPLNSYTSTNKDYEAVNLVFESTRTYFTLDVSALLRSEPACKLATRSTTHDVYFLSSEPNVEVQLHLTPTSAMSILSATTDGHINEVYVDEFVSPLVGTLSLSPEFLLALDARNNLFIISTCTAKLCKVIMNYEIFREEQLKSSEHSCNDRPLSRSTSSFIADLRRARRCFHLSRDRLFILLNDGSMAIIH